MTKTVTAKQKTAALSIDIDEIDCYAAIHDVSTVPRRAQSAIYERAIPRFEQLFDSLGVRATFFSIGKDLEQQVNAKTIERLHRAGHEIANHSWHHLYDFTVLEEKSLGAEIRSGADAIENACGQRPVGFRAPGYTITDRVFRELEEQGYQYDSSVFPCPSYYAAKAGAIVWIRSRGRQSRSIVDDPRVLLAPTDPYRVGRPYWELGNGLLELPIGVTPTMRLPFIGTSIVLANRMVRKALLRGMKRKNFINIELHGIDLADAENDGLAFLRGHQPDLRVPAAKKEKRLRDVIRSLRASGYKFLTLREAANEFGQKHSKPWLT